MSDDRNNDKYKIRKNGWLALAVLLFFCTLSALRYWIFDFNFFAFLLGGVFLYGGYQSLKKSGVLDNDEEAKHKAQKSADREGSIQDSSLYEQDTLAAALPPVSLAVPAFDLEALAAFPFQNKAYVMHRFEYVDEKDASKPKTRDYFYADSKALLESVKALAGIEFLIDDIRTKNPEIPELRTKVDKLVPLNSPIKENELPLNSVRLVCNMPNDKDSKPQYPLEIHFRVFDEESQSGSSATLGYTKEGKLAIAHESFIYAQKFYDVFYKCLEKELRIELIACRENLEQSPQPLYTCKNETLGS